MLQLINIKKTYHVGDFQQNALNGISVSFRKTEFVAVVGPSGSGKTTTLNIIGGLDRYDSGDIIINGKSTKDFKDADWDAYRNNSIGFVFQNYNLINHISVLDNVEMGMTLSGKSNKQRRSRAEEVLKRVGLVDHMHKLPNQLSGGQMQRVAIARALANGPDIIMLDEPTGALDTATSIQIMDLVKEIAGDKLVILVTHNIEIANRYADRIIHMQDGEIVSDSHPFQIETAETPHYQLKKTSMSYRQALALSFNNLKTKLSRALITAFAGSIGIIGIGLVLSLSNGLNTQIAAMETGTLSDFPLSISQTAYIMRDNQGMMIPEQDTTGEFPEGTAFVIKDDTVNTFMHTNLITQDFVDHIQAMDPALYNEIAYLRSVRMNLFTTAENGAITAVNTRNVDWSEIPANTDFILANYDLLAGTFPTAKEELLLVVDTYNNIDLSLLTAIGYSADVATLDFADLIGKQFKIVLNDDYYQFNPLTSLYLANPDSAALYALPTALTMTIVGVMRPDAEANARIMGSGIHYLPELTDFILADAVLSAVAVAQTSGSTSVLTGIELTEKEKTAMLRTLGADSTPTSFQIYPVDFDAKAAIKEYLDSYNSGKLEADQIIYNDLAETITSTVGTLLDTVTYVLIAFSAISLLVSSIMIGIITYVSVLERTKEIGILRSLGARKKDISRVFNAETVLIGFTAGMMGVIIAWLLTIPLNIIIGNLVDGIDHLASFSLLAMVSLVVVSVALTFISGLVPSGIAARKDPVEALRTE
jgi:putative ABC transport system permease protein